MSAVIEAEPGCVWRALTEPDELCAWDENLLAPVDPSAGYPCPESPQRWRYLLGGVQLILRERPLEVAPERRLQSALWLGGMKLEQTYSLAPEGEARTRVSIRIAAGNSIPVLGATIDRFEVRQLVTERVDRLLRALQKWCEAQPDAQPKKPKAAKRNQSRKPRKLSPSRGAPSSPS
jgi:hypothetical protein